MDHIPEDMGMLKVKADQGSHKASEGVDFRHGLLRVSHYQPLLVGTHTSSPDQWGSATGRGLPATRSSAKLGWMQTFTATPGQQGSVVQATTVSIKFKEIW